MSKCLIIGCDGFIGSHLAQYLNEKGHSVFGTVYDNNENVQIIKEVATIFEVDILNRDKIKKIISEVKAEWLFHLAAQSLPEVSWKNPELTFHVNIIGTLYLLDSVRETGIGSKIIMFCSSGEYAASSANELPIREDYKLEPSNPYALSKLAQDYLSLLYWRFYKVNIVRVRPFFIIGPRKIGDVSSDFAKSIVRIENGEAGWIDVGNLEAIRDFLDVRDACSAFECLAEKGEPGEVYNVCSGKGHKIKELLEMFIGNAKKPIEIRLDQNKLRRIDELVKIGDNSKLRRLGWNPVMPLSQTLVDILSFWRRVGKSD